MMKLPKQCATKLKKLAKRFYDEELDSSEFICEIENMLQSYAWYRNMKRADQMKLSSDIFDQVWEAEYGTI